MSSLIHSAASDDVATAVRPIRAGYTAAAVGPTRAGPKPLDDLALLHELWQISRFGWIAQATILRSLMIASGHEVATAAVAERCGNCGNSGGSRSATARLARANANGA